MDLDLWDWLGRQKHRLITEEIRYINTVEGTISHKATEWYALPILTL